LSRKCGSLDVSNPIGLDDLLKNLKKIMIEKSGDMSPPPKTDKGRARMTPWVVYGATTTLDKEIGPSPEMQKRGLLAETPCGLISPRDQGACGVAVEGFGWA
jgi:hypothetical protein